MKIKSDGTVDGTRIYDDDGKDLTAELRVYRVEIEHGSKDMPRAILYCYPEELDITILDDQAIKTIAYKS